MSTETYSQQILKQALLGYLSDSEWGCKAIRMGCELGGVLTEELLLSTLNITPSSKIEDLFEVWDKYNGAKPTSTCISTALYSSGKSPLFFSLAKRVSLGSLSSKENIHRFLEFWMKDKEWEPSFELLTALHDQKFNQLVNENVWTVIIKTQGKACSGSDASNRLREWMEKFDHETPARTDALCILAATGHLWASKKINNISSAGRQAYLWLRSYLSSMDISPDATLSADHFEALGESKLGKSSLTFSRSAFFDQSITTFPFSCTAIAAMSVSKPEFLQSYLRGRDTPISGEEIDDCAMLLLYVMNRMIRGFLKIESSKNLPHGTGVARHFIPILSVLYEHTPEVLDVFEKHLGLLEASSRFRKDFLTSSLWKEHPEDMALKLRHGLTFGILDSGASVGSESERGDIFVTCLKRLYRNVLFPEDLISKVQEVVHAKDQKAIRKDVLKENIELLLVSSNGQTNKSKRRI